MRNAILNSTNQEGHIVRFSAYQQRKAKEEGKSPYIHKRISEITAQAGDEDREDRMAILGVEDPDFTLETEDSVFYRFFQWMDENFSQRDCHIFYHTFGICGYELLKGTELAELFGLSAAAISVSNKKVIRAIRANNEIMDMLSDLLKN